MTIRYRVGAALTSLLLLLAAGSPANAKPVHHKHRQRHRLAESPIVAPLPPGDLYSRRALRRARIILQLKLLELRAERLDRVRKAIEHRVPVDRLLKDT
jgi:hypothetical protein